MRLSDILTLLCLLAHFFSCALACETEEPQIVEERYPCNISQSIWTKEKCMLFFQCDKQIQRIVPSECSRNITIKVKNCCRGFNRDTFSGSCIDIDECAATSHNCESTCINMPGSFRCDCSVGYILASDEKSCVDINECEDDLAHNCSHACRNSNGSYQCICPEHLRLGQDGMTCEEIQTSVRVITSTISSSSVLTSSDLPLPEITVTQISGYRTSDSTSKSRLLPIWIGAGCAVLIALIAAIFAIVYRRRKNRWSLFRQVFMKKTFGSSPNNSIVDMINTSAKSRVLDDIDTPGLLGLDTSKARVFKKTSNPFAITSSNKCSVAFSSSSQATGVSSVTLMCPNVIASDSSSKSTRASTVSSDQDGNHIYCELRDGQLPFSSTPAPISVISDNNRPTSPCYASLPISDVPLVLTPVTSAENVTESRANPNIYNNS